MRLISYKKAAVALSAAVFIGGAYLPVRAQEAVGEYIGFNTFTIDDKEAPFAESLQTVWQSRAAMLGYENPGISRVESDALNVREIPSLDGKIVGKMPKDTVCEVVTVTEEGWVHIRSGQVEGFVRKEYLTTGAIALAKLNKLMKTVVVVKVDELNVRKNPGMGSTVMTRVSGEEELLFLEENKDWIKVSVRGLEGYVAAEYVALEKRLPTAVTMEELLRSERKAGGDDMKNVRNDLVEYAKQFLGNPYVWGGTSLTKGADCSGFVLSIYQNYGVELPHSSVSQSNMGSAVSETDLLPGDLVFYSKGGRINHVAIYIGDGKVIHASSPETGIKISNVDYRVPVKYVRIL